jgi:beta-lactamase class A
MRPDRRRHLILGLSAALAACAPSVRASKPFDGKLLDHEFPTLAERARPGAFNAAILDLQTNAAWYWNISQPFPLEGAFILPVAVSAMAELEAARLQLTEKVTVRGTDLSPPYSLISQSWLDTKPNFAMNVSVADLIALAVEFNDNTAADVLMKLIGGPGAVTAWLRGKGMTEIRIDRYAREVEVEISGMPSFRAAWRTPAAFAAAREATPVGERQSAMNAYLDDPRDTTTGLDAMTFLAKLARNELISKASSDVLFKTMRQTRNGARLLAAGLPPGADFVHKAGLSVSDLGFTPAYSDLGLVTFKNGRRFAMAAFLAGSTAAPAERERLFADASRLMVRAAGEADR